MVVVTREVECIVQNNVRYCKKEEDSARADWFSLIFLMLFLVYTVFLIKLDFRYNTKWKLVIIWFFAPILLIALILII